MPDERLDDLKRQLDALEQQIASLKQLHTDAPAADREEPLAASVRRLKFIRTELDSLIAHFDALLAAWTRQSAAGEVLSLPECTRRVAALEVRLGHLERRLPPEETPHA